MKLKKHLRQLHIDMMVVPISTILILCILFLVFPQRSTAYLESIRSWIGQKFMYLFLGIAVLFFAASIIIALSKYGNIRLGNDSKPRYSTITWGTMIFTSTMSADVIFYSLCEWAMYGNDPYIKSQPHGFKNMALTYSLFHWGPLAWGFYILLAIAFGYMLYVKRNPSQHISEACRPILHSQTDKLLGKIIDYLAIIALIAGTATTFSMSMPLLSAAVSNVTKIPNNRYLSLIMLVTVALIYTSTVIFGTNGIAKLSQLCTLFFVMLILYFFFGGQELFILKHGFYSLEKLITNFFSMALITSPTPKRHFMLDWTVYYWSYWMVWSVATPFFIGMISQGRTIRNIVFGGYFWGLMGTYISFLTLGNYGIKQQLNGSIHVLQSVAHNGSYATSILQVFKTFPVPIIGFILLIITMLGLYSTVFDGITMVVSSYSYRYLKPSDEPAKSVRIFWSITFILLPMTLIATGSSVYRLQSVAIIAALPIAFIFLIIFISFLSELFHHTN